MITCAHEFLSMLKGQVLKAMNNFLDLLVKFDCHQHIFVDMFYILSCEYVHNDDIFLGIFM